MTRPQPQPADLVAWSVEVEDPGDLLSWLPAGDAFAFLRGGDGLVGWGVATRLTLGEVTRSGEEIATATERLLASMTIRDDVAVAGSGPVALASLVFDPAATGSVVVVPKVVLGRREGRCWLTLVTPQGAVAVPQLRRRPTAAATPVEAHIRGFVPAESEWREAVVTAITQLRRNELEKVVLARAVDVEAGEPVDPRVVAARLSERFPACFTYVCDGLVGASPELLVRRIGRRAESLVLAGSVRRGRSAEEDAELEAGLLTSTKDQHEHSLAVESVRQTLESVAVDVSSASHPQIVRLANISHLGTLLQAWLPDPAPSAMKLAATLHPTAAVGGVPSERALQMIRELEPASRDRYAGPVGWVDANGDGEFAIALRCAQINGGQARVWAGAGIVSESEPDAEVAETTVKLDAALSALLG